MIDIDVRGLESVTSSLMRMAQETPKALRNAINDTAFNVRDGERQEIKRVFNRPTPWVSKTVYVQKATTQTMKATVGPTDYFSGGYLGTFRTPWDNVIQHHVYSGARGHKASERRLQAAGILPRGWFYVPGAGARLNQYGNMASGQVIQILQWINAMGLYSGDNTNRRDSERRRRNATERRGESYFAVIPGQRNAHLRPGVYKKRGRNIVPVMIFVRNTSYRSRLDWFGVGRRIVDQRFPEHLAREIARLRR